MVLEANSEFSKKQQEKLINQQIRMDKELASKSKVAELTFDINANLY
ncbi:hypothetical protein PPAR_a1024 [Pseudoalteromonas paragorgicola KMM 3548]|nr:hypothetical protein [Pseudoalteromonas distincta KMM 3548]